MIFISVFLLQAMEIVDAIAESYPKSRVQLMVRYCLIKFE